MVTVGCMSGDAAASALTSTSKILRRLSSVSERMQRPSGDHLQPRVKVSKVA
jgi:hypothetical protein